MKSDVLLKQLTVFYLSFFGLIDKQLILSYCYFYLFEIKKLNGQSTQNQAAENRRKISLSKLLKHFLSNSHTVN